MAPRRRGTRAATIRLERPELARIGNEATHPVDYHSPSSCAGRFPGGLR